MTTTKPDLTRKLDFTKNPNLSRALEKHFETFPSGVAAQWLERDGISSMKDPLRRFELAFMVDTLQAAVQRALDDAADRFERLEARPTLRDCGVWHPDKTYEAGDVVTHSGSAWFAQRVGTAQRPGESGDFWRLAVKKGRDGRDVRGERGGA